MPFLMKLGKFGFFLEKIAKKAKATRNVAKAT